MSDSCRYGDYGTAGWTKLAPKNVNKILTFERRVLVYDVSCNVQNQVADLQ